MAKRYDVFVSYARADADAGLLNTSALKRAVENGLRRAGVVQPKVFLDRHQLRAMENWWPSILQALSESTTLLVLLSPQYLHRPYCYREWDEFRAHPGGTDSVAVLPVADIDEQAWKGREEWRQGLSRAQWLSFDSDDRWANELAEQLQLRGRQRRIALSLPGNLPLPVATFVGRSVELFLIQQSLSMPATNQTTVLYGAPGMGKTQVALQFAHRYRHAFEGGAWLVDARDTDLRGALVRLGDDPGLEPRLASGEASSSALWQRVLDAIKPVNWNPSDNRTTLVVLDHSTSMGILERPGFYVPSWQRLMATTSTEPSGADAASPNFIAIKPLPHADVLRLLRAWQPRRGEFNIPRFNSLEEEGLASVLAEHLGGWPLAAERIAWRLGDSDIRLTDLIGHLGGCAAHELDRSCGFHQYPETRLLAEVITEWLDTLSPVDVSALQFAAHMTVGKTPSKWLRRWVGQEHDESNWADLKRHWRLSGVVQDDDCAILTVNPLLSKGAAARLPENDKQQVEELVKAVLQDAASTTSATESPEWEALIDTATSLPSLPPLLSKAIDAAIPSLAGEIPDSVLLRWSMRRLPEINASFNANTRDESTRFVAILALQASAYAYRFATPRYSVQLVRKALDLGRHRFHANDPKPLRGALNLLLAKLLEDSSPKEAFDAARMATHIFRQPPPDDRTIAYATLLTATLGERLNLAHWEKDADQAERSFLHHTWAVSDSPEANRDLTNAYLQLSEIWEETNPKRALVLTSKAYRLAKEQLQEGGSPSRHRDLAKSARRYALLVAQTEPRTALTLLREATEIYAGFSGSTAQERPHLIDVASCALEFALVADAQPDRNEIPDERSEEKLAVAHSMLNQLKQTPGVRPSEQLLEARIHQVEARLRVTEEDRRTGLLLKALDIRRTIGPGTNRTASWLSIEIADRLRPTDAEAAARKYASALETARPDSPEEWLARARTATNTDLAHRAAAGSREIFMKHPTSELALRCLVEAYNELCRLAPWQDEERRFRINEARRLFNHASANDPTHAAAD